LAELVGSIFASMFGKLSWLATIIISMFPVIELKGAIPVGMSTDFWGEHALSGMGSFLLSLLGSCMVVPLLALFFKPIIRWLKSTSLFRKVAERIENKVHSKSKKIADKAEEECKSTKKKIFIKMLGVFTFVAVPLPLTGVWTGTCIAVAIGLNFWQSILSVILGNIVAGFIIVFICSVFPQFTTLIFFIMLAIVILVVLIGLIKILINRKPDDNKENQE